MSESHHVFDATADDFQQAVLAKSSEVPVLVDFWAPWCGPCRVLGPTLEKLAAEMDGAFVLAKVDSDRDPELAARYGVQGIPNVQLFKDGEVVDQFVGALPEARVRDFLRRHCPNAADGLVEEAAALAEGGELEAGRELLERALRDGGGDAARLGLARLALARQDLDEVERRVGELRAGGDEHEAGQSLLRLVELARAANAVGDADACRRRLEADDADREARHALGVHAAAAGRHREALEHFLCLAQTDRHWQDEAARRAMLVVFQIVGAREPLAEEFRDHLRRVYY